MTSKEIFYAAIAGEKADRFPVIAPYSMLSNADHWVEVTGEPVWKYYEWLLSDPDEQVKRYQQFDAAMPFDHFQPWFAPSVQERENVSIIQKEGKFYYKDKRNDTLKPVPNTIHESGSGGGENETRYIFDTGDIKVHIKVEKAEQLVADGHNDYIMASKDAFKDKFIWSGGVVNTFFSCTYYVGMENFYCMLREEPELVMEMSQRIQEKNMETIRALSMAGGDAIYIDDATATTDMISLEMYEKFSLPFLTEQVKEIKRLGKKAVLVYFGGIEDRVEQIVSSGADVLVMEAAMKGFVNDYKAISKQINGRLCLAGNLNPYSDVECLTEEALEALIQEQASYGKLTGKYITSTGSPLTPKTSVARIAKYIEMGRKCKPE